MKKALLLPFLAGLALGAPQGEAKPKSPLKTRIIQELPKEKKSKIILELPKEKKRKKKKEVKDTTLRNRFGFSANYTTLSLNKKQYETGFSFNSNGDINWQALNWLNLRTKFNFNYTSLGFKSENASETITDLNLSLEGRTQLYASKSKKFWLGFGAKHIMQDTQLIYHGTNAHETRHNTGPLISLAFESQHFDFYTSVAVLMGKVTSSFDRDRKILMENVTIECIPKVWRFEFPLKANIYHWSINDLVVDRHKIHAELKSQIGYLITPHFKISLNAEYIKHVGDDNYNEARVGLGGELKW